MKEFFTIQEVARLYDICPDTLRYYEQQGLIHPKRRTNNYRVYSINDICDLNVIRGLRALDIPIERMRAYFKDCTLASTLNLLNEEETVIDEKIKALQEAKRTLKGRREKLTHATQNGKNVVHFHTLPARPCFQLNARVIRDAEIDWALRKLALRHPGFVKLLGNQRMGAFLNTQSAQQNDFDHFDSVFILGCPKKEADNILPAGEYACLFYQGAYHQLPAAYQTLTQTLTENRLTPCEAVMELYHIDAHDTDLEAEFLTELQVRFTR